MSNPDQEDELLALASIYEDGTFNASQEGETPGGCFCANLELPQPFYVKILPSTVKESSDSSDNLHMVKFLPPIRLHFEFPTGYPLEEPPKFNLSCQWLTLQQLSSLCNKLDEIWKENCGEVIVFSWTNFLKDEALEFLQINSPLDLTKVVYKRRRHKSDSSNTTIIKDNVNNPVHAVICDTKPWSGNDVDTSSDPKVTFDPRGIQDIASQDLLLRTILDYNSEQKEKEFKSTLFTCEVCFSEKLGTLCTSFVGCDHVYCKECMRGYFEVQISDGNVKGLTCPGNKCESQAHPGQVKELVSEALFHRYDRLLLQCSLDTMSDILYCPRQACGCAVLVDQEHSTGSCPACHYVFCIYCKLSYHGVSPCKINASDILKIRADYLKADDHSKKLLERRYGKRTIQKLIEESFTHEWLNENSKQCPHCKTSIQKIDGCNKMTCTKCHTYFCWICMQQLSRVNPYHHFNTMGTPCFNKLFQGVVIDEEDLGDAFDEDFLPEEWL